MAELSLASRWLGARRLLSCSGLRFGAPFVSQCRLRSQWSYATPHRKAPRLSDGSELGADLKAWITRALLQLAQIGAFDGHGCSEGSGPGHCFSPAARRRPDRNSARC